MLKKFFSVIALIIAISISNFAAAENFVSFGNDGGYADLDSVKVENYNPPTYILSVVTYSYDGNNSNRTKFRLNYDKKRLKFICLKLKFSWKERGRWLNNFEADVSELALTPAGMMQILKKES